MSYDIRLINLETRKTCEVTEGHDLRGGTYCVGGTTECWLNVTYNYSEFYYKVFGEKGIRTIYGMTGKDSIPILESAISQLGDDVSDNYWDATEGNAKKALEGLLLLAEMKPDGVWDGD